MELAEIRAELAAVGVNIAGMTYDSRSVLEKFSRKHALGYPMLGDDEAQHVTAYGILNEQYPAGHRAFGIPHPGIVLLTRDGIVASKLARPGYKERPGNDEVLARVTGWLAAPAALTQPNASIRAGAPAAPAAAVRP